MEFQSSLPPEHALPALLLNLFTLAAGTVMYFFPPKKINGVYGYRTHRSMKSEAHWKIAQIYSAKKMIQLSILLFMICLGIAYLPLSPGAETSISLTLSLAGIFLIFYFTEKKLKS